MDINWENKFWIVPGSIFAYLAYYAYYEFQKGICNKQNRNTRITRNTPNTGNAVIGAIALTIYSNSSSITSIRHHMSKKIAYDGREDWDKSQLIALCDAYEAYQYQSKWKKICSDNRFRNQLGGRGPDLVGAKARTIGLAQANNKTTVDEIRNRIQSGEFQRTVCTIC